MVGAIVAVLEVEPVAIAGAFELEVAGGFVVGLEVVVGGFVVELEFVDVLVEVL